jgi:DNA ligase (NAD+)
MAQVLANHFRSIDRLASASEEELMGVSAVGPKIAESVATFFRQGENLRLIDKLRKAGVKLEEEGAGTAEERPLSGQEFVLTGRLESFSRQDAEVRIQALGGVAKDNVTRSTAYLVVGEDPGSKLARAQQLGTKQLTEEEFLRLLEEKS